jgi:hypothetical protein
MRTADPIHRPAVFDGRDRSEARMPLRQMQTLLGSTTAGMAGVCEAVSEIAHLSPMVIALRTDAAFAAFADPSKASAGEPLRMIAEKIDAVAQSSLAATLEAGLAVGRSLTERRLPLDAAFRVATAAMEPIRGRLRDNVRRLAPGRLDATRTSE